MIRTIERGRTYKIVEGQGSFVTAFSSFGTEGLHPHAEFFIPEINYRLGQRGQSGDWDLSQQEFIDLVNEIAREYWDEQARDSSSTNDVLD